MRWTKIKNIIILILLLVNGCLLAQVGLREWNSHANERETRERMVEILSRNGLTYLPGEIPGKMELQSLRVTLAPLSRENAAALVGVITDSQTSGGQTTYSGADGRVTATATGEVFVEYSESAHISETAALERISKAGVALHPVSSTAEGTLCTLYYDKVPIPGETARGSFYADGSSRNWSFRFLAGEVETLSTEETLNAVTALARLLDELNRGEGYVCSQITALYPGYVATGTSTVTLTPAWFVETDTWQFVIDGVTGSVTAFS